MTPGVIGVRPGFDALGFDPAPGSLAAIEALSNTHTAVSRALADAHHGLTSAGEAAGSWTGDAARAFRTTVSELPDYLDKARQSLSSAASTLGGWHADLAPMQRSADQLEQQAAEARSGLETARAHPDLALAGRFFFDPEELRAAEQRLANAQAALARRLADLEAILARAEQLLAQHTDLAAHVAELLTRATELAGDEPGFFESLGEQVGRALDVAVDQIGDGIVDLASDAWAVVQDNANLIAALSDVTADLSMMVGLIGLGFDVSGVGAPVGAVLGAVSGGMSALALGGHALARAGGADVPTETLIWDGIGVGTFGIGKVGELVKSVEQEARALSGGITGAVPIIQADREQRYDRDAATVFDDIEKYWIPRDPVQWGLMPVAPVVVPFINAVNDGRAADDLARQERGR